TTAAPSPTSRYFTLNFTLTNLQYTADLDAPSSHKFISTMKVINHYVSLALVLPILCYGGNLNLVFCKHQQCPKECLTFLLRSGRNRDDTGVDAVCSYKNNVSLARFDREKVYHELSTMTNGVTKLGHYSLEKNSLHVNG
ncbi:MUC16 protein, partial [Circaetus pectoralis]|nr:MUC16 protein [Circaetus pectoralis]